jgi:hypothetical protein
MVIQTEVIQTRVPVKNVKVLATPTLPLTGVSTAV